MNLEGVLARAKDRVDVESFRMICSALIINSNRGGDVLHILERMSDSIRELQKLKKKLMTETAEVRAQEKIILFITPRSDCLFARLTLTYRGFSSVRFPASITGDCCDVAGNRSLVGAKNRKGYDITDTPDDHTETNIDTLCSRLVVHDRDVDD